LQQDRRDSRCGVDPTKREKKDIEAVRAAHFPERTYKNFSQLFKKKAAAFVNDQEIAGARDD
jgi:hypothetical protein